MLLDGALRFAHQARSGLASRNYEQSYAGFTQCRAIVTELMTSINDAPAPELAEKVRALYAFFFTELVEANMNKDVARVDKVIELLEFERETWAMLMDKLAEERAAAGNAPAAQKRSLSFNA